MKEEEIGIKNDSGKLQWTLVPWKEMEEVVRVLMHGAEKYSRDNWKKVEPQRYKDAILRHLISYIGGEALDPDSGYHHLAGVICSALFLMYSEAPTNPMEKIPHYDDKIRFNY